MASYSPFNKHLYPGGPPSESLSELSSADSSDWSDLRTIAVQLGVSNPDELASERFKIDRQKLEIMVNTETNLEGMNKAEDFFDKVSNFIFKHKKKKKIKLFTDNERNNNCRQLAFSFKNWRQNKKRSTR